MFCFFFPSNKNLTEHIVTSSDERVAPQGYWQEPLDVGYAESTVRCLSCFPEEPPAFPEPMINPCAGGAQRRTRSLRTLLFAAYCTREKLHLAPAQPRL